jgi:hypothetical protein
MRSRWGRKLFKPCDLDGYEVVWVMLNRRLVGIHKRAFIRDWFRDEWVVFFDLIGCEIDPSDKSVCLNNNKKKMHGFPQNWSTLRLVNYSWALKFKSIFWEQNRINSCKLISF